MEIIKKINKKGQIDIAIVIGSIIVPISAMIGALMFAWLLLSPTVDLCRIAETISYDVAVLSDVVYSVPDDITIIYKAPSVCTFYSPQTMPVYVFLEFMEEPEPTHFPTDNSIWYRGYFYDTNLNRITLSIDDATPEYNWYDIDAGSLVVSSECDPLQVGCVFQLGDTDYTIRDPLKVSGYFEKAVLHPELEGGAARNILSCMDNRLIITHFGLTSIGYNTTYPYYIQPWQKVVPFYSMSIVPGAIYDVADEEWYSFGFNIRSYANIKDESLSRFRGTVVYPVSDGVYVSKHRTAYYNTLSPSITGKEDLVTYIVKLALSVCESTQTETENTFFLPPSYYLNVNKSQNNISLYEQMYYQDFAGTPQPLRLINTLNMGQLLQGSTNQDGDDCVYSFDADLSSHNFSEWAKIDVSIRRTGSNVVISVVEDTS